MKAYRRRSFTRGTVRGRAAHTHQHAECSTCGCSVWAPVDTVPTCGTCQLAAAGVTGRGAMPSGRRPSVHRDSCGIVRQECCGEACSEIDGTGRAMFHVQSELDEDGLCAFCAAPGAVVRLGGSHSRRMAKFYQNTVRYHGFSPALVVELDENGRIAVTETDQTSGRQRCLRVFPDALPWWGSGWTVNGRRFYVNWDSGD